MAERVPADVIYNSLLQNDDAFTHLQHFVRQAEEFHAKDSDFDVVKEYLQLSGNCHELGQHVKELATCDPQHAMALLNAMCHILIRLASDLPVFIAAGTSIVNEMLSYGMKTIFNFLKMKQKSSRTKSALHLLTAMIALGNQTAHQVVAKLNFSNPQYLHLLNRTNFSEDEDVRSAFLNLIVLVITVCNNNIIRQIVEVKGFLNSIFPGLVSDRVSTITLVLNTFKQFIVENNYIPKTTKLHLFNDHSLKPVIQLYTWKGPVRYKKHGKRKLGEEKCSVAYDVSDEELVEVRSCTHEFMLAICCSYKNGIIFSDLSCGASGRNYNIVITNMLKLFPTPYMDPLMSNFVISVLQTCPDQLKHYLPIFRDSFVPRLSTSWLNVVDFLEKILKSQNIVLLLFKTEMKRSTTVLVSIAKTFCLLDVLIASDISEVFNSGHRVLCYYLSRFLLRILTQIEAVVKFCDHPDSANVPYDVSELSNFKLLFLSVMFPRFPAVDKLQNYWHKITYEKSEIVQDEAVKDLPIPTFSEELSTLIEVIKFYKTFSSELNREFDFDLRQMFNGLKICNSVLPTSDLNKVYSSIIDFCSKENTASLWNKQKVVNSPLVLIRDIYLAAHESKDLSGVRNILHKIFLCTNVFINCQWEIDLWLDSLECAKSKHIPIIFDFINETIHFLLKQVNKHIEDQDMPDLIEVIKDEKSDDINESNAPEDSDVLYIPPDQKNFSNFTVAAFQTLQSLSEDKTKGCQMFIEKALDPLMHYQHSPKSLFTAIDPYKSLITPYLYEYWKFLSLATEIKFSFEILCSGNSSCTLDIEDHLRQNFVATHFSPVKPSLCNLNNMCANLNVKSIQRTVWQLLAYVDFEVKLILKRKTKNSALVSYMQLLKQLLLCLPISNDDVMDTNCDVESIKVENSHMIPTESALEIFKDFFNHPTILKLFLFDIKIVENKSEDLSNSVILATKLVLDVVQNVLTLSDKMLSSFLIPFKKKVLKYLYKNRKSGIESSVELASIIGTFSPLFGTNDIQVLLENLLSIENNAITDLDEYFSSLCLLMQTFIEKEETVLLSSTSINGLISKFISLPKKKRKIFRQYLLNLLQKHPSYGLLLSEETALLLLQHKSSKDLSILGALIGYNDKFRKVTQTFIKDKFDESDITEYMYLVSRCLCNCSNDAQDSDFKDLVSSNFCSTFEDLVFSNISADLDTLHECGIGKAMQLLFCQKHTNPKKLQDFCKLILRNPENEMPSLSKMLIILQLFESWKFYSHETNKVKLQILKVCCLWLSSGLNENFNCPELFNFIKELLQSMNDFEISKVTDVTDFFSKCLKFALKYADIGKDLLKILSLLCEKTDGNNLPVQTLHGLLTGHSQFFKIMLSDEGVKNLKENLIDLLIILTKLDPTVCKENHIGLLLSAYGASMSSVDQKLLYLLKLYADNNIDMSQYRPFLWGKSAISHYSIMKTTQSFLWKQPKLQDILSLLLPDKIGNTLLYFPLHMKLEPTAELVEVEEHLANKIYDMRFFLPLFAHLLSPGAFVNCSQFIQSKAPQLIFISLSSMEPPVRALSLYCLSQFYQHLESAYFKEKGIWLCLLDSLKNSIASTNPKIPNIVSLFLARAIDVFTKPEHKLFRPLYTFILRKPLLDIGQVPEFYNLFNSSYIEHRILRLWLLNLLGDGLRSSLDFHICEKRYIFTTLLTHYVSCLSTNQEKVAILQTLNSAVKIKSSAHTLCQKGLLVWLQKVVEESDLSEVDILKAVCEVMKNLEVNVPDRYNFIHVLWNFIPKMKFLDLYTIKTFLSSLLHALTTLKNSDKSSWPGYRVSSDEVDQLYELWKSLTEKFQLKERNILLEKVSVELVNVNECSLLCSKIVTFWEPLLDATTPDLLYKTQIKSLINVLELMLKQVDNSSFYSNELPVWLLNYVVADKKYELVKLFLSSERNKILSLVFQLFESCLKEKQEKKLSKSSTCDHWKKFLLYVKDVSRNSNITPTSTFQQIIDAVHNEI